MKKPISNKCFQIRKHVYEINSVNKAGGTLWKIRLLSFLRRHNHPFEGGRLYVIGIKGKLIIQIRGFFFFR